MTHYQQLYDFFKYSYENIFKQKLLMKEIMRGGTKYYKEYKRHLFLHDEGLKVIRLLPKPSIVNQESKIIVFNQVIWGRLEHWYRSLVDREMVGTIAMEGRKIEMGQMSH